jgi:DNA-binding PucR family transcriptional regulator
VVREPVARQTRQAGVTEPQGWLALSSAGANAATLPALAREARFTAALLQQRLIAGPAARFDAINDLGPYRLLFRLWGTPELERFSAEALGDLVAHDRRGALRETLLTFLESGGSHVDAARQLNIHRNTLAYRLKQIADFTHRDPADPGARLTLHLALLANTLPPAP